MVDDCDCDCDCDCGSLLWVGSILSHFIPFFRDCCDCLVVFFRSFSCFLCCLWMKTGQTRRPSKDSSSRPQRSVATASEHPRGSGRGGRSKEASSRGDRKPNGRNDPKPVSSSSSAAAPPKRPAQQPEFDTLVSQISASKCDLFSEPVLELCDRCVLHVFDNNSKKKKKD